jgi:hypothetical protein
MSKQDIIRLEAEGEFPFTFYIEKAVASTENEEMILEGIASTTNVDHDNERMSKDALRAMEATINKEGVPLRVEHQKDAAAVIGRVFKAWVDERNQLHIRASLDKSHPVSPILHHSMKEQGVKMGLSVGGVVKSAMKEFSESVGGLVKTFYDVALQEVSVTPRPANYDSWLVAKSIAKDTKEAEKYSENVGLRKEFLFENSQLDYLQAFAKSVPDKAWRKVETTDINKNENNMAKDNINKDNEHDTTDTAKSVSRPEFDGLSKAVQDLIGAVSKGFDGIGTLIGKMGDGPKDQVNPSKAKPEDESPAAKSSEKDEETEKAEDDKEDTEKSEDTDDMKEKSEDKDDTEKAAKDDTYDMETVTRSIATIDKLSKKLDGMKKAEEKEETEKAEDKDEEDAEKSEDKDETAEKSSKHHPLDVFVVKMTDLMEKAVGRMEGKGKRVLGFEKSFAEDVQSDPALQTELMKLLKMPGFKKSVAMGVPMMVTKDGKRYPLMAVPEQVEKSADTPKDFKTLYKSRYSSGSQEQQG